MATSRVVLYTDDPEEGGVAIYTDAMACGLAQRGFQVACVQSESRSPMIVRQRQCGVQHHWLDFNTRADSLRMAINHEDARQAYAATRPDVILVANCHPFSNIAAKAVAVERGIPFIIVENYVNYFAELPPDFRQFQPAVANHYQHAKAVVAVSRDNLDILRECYWLAPDKGEVIHYGRPDRFFSPGNPQVRARLRGELQVPQDAVLCVTVGRLDTVKGYHLILAAMQKLALRPIWPRLYFAWLGTGPLALPLEAGLKKIGAWSHVRMLGRRWDVADWLDAGDVFLLPSYCEGMPLSIMEAMARGLPVMASAVSGNSEELGDTGKLLPSPNDDESATVAGMVATLDLWGSDERLRASVGAAGQTRAGAMFREERMIDQTQRLLESALSKS